MTRKTNWHTFWLGLIAAILVAFALALQAGGVPIPKEAAWLTPIVVAAITYATPRLREMAGEGKPETASPPIALPQPPSQPTPEQLWQQYWGRGQQSGRVIAPLKDGHTTPGLGGTEPPVPVPTDDGNRHWENDHEEAAPVQTDPSPPTSPAGSDPPAEVPRG